MSPGRPAIGLPAIRLTLIKTHLQSLLLCVMQPFHDVPSHFGRDVSGGALPGDSRNCLRTVTARGVPIDEARSRAKQSFHGIQTDSAVLRGIPTRMCHHFAQPCARDEHRSAVACACLGKSRDEAISLRNTFAFPLSSYASAMNTRTSGLSVSLRAVPVGTPASGNRRSVQSQRLERWVGI